MNSSTDSPTGAKGEVIYNDKRNVQEGQEGNLVWWHLEERRTPPHPCDHSDIVQE
jgi:hypothetical protein